MATSTRPAAVPAVSLRGIRKTFGHVIANAGIDLDIRAGEIHALLGENGAGKTTLMNILYGLIQADEGAIAIRGRTARIASPRDAIALGVAMVHQQFMLVPTFSVVQNVVLGLGTPQGPMLATRQPAERIRRLSRTYGFEVDPAAEIGQLSVGEQQRVEIIKALYRDVDILILDEPTSVLTPQEAGQLFTILRTFVGEGHTVIFISHKLNEVLSVSDRTTVLRDGQAIGTIETAGATRSQLARMMVGRDVSLDFQGERSTCGRPLLRLEAVSAASDRGLLGLRDVSLTVHEGEILGVAGVDGNGQRELAEVVVGLRRVLRGEITLAGTRVTHQTPRQAIDRGIGLIPEGRREMGLLADLPVWRNLLLGAHDRQPYAHRGFLRGGAIIRMAQRLLGEFDVRPADPERPAGSLSGGNQQKLVLARTIDRRPPLLVASQPTRGLDIGTTEYVRRRLLEERERGAAILLVSTDLQEILSLSDRTAVLYEGKVMGIVDGRQVDTEQLGLMMAGVPLAGQESMRHA